jgi:hypothetical protein
MTTTNDNGTPTLDWHQCAGHGTGYHDHIVAVSGDHAVAVADGVDAIGVQWTVWHRDELGELCRAAAMDSTTFARALDSGDLRDDYADIAPIHEAYAQTARTAQLDAEDYLLARYYSGAVS